MDDLEKIVNIDYNPTPDEIFTHLCYISKILKESSIKFWIMYGTLLGSVRENNIISYDYDFDLGILYEDCEKILELNDIIKQDGYELEKALGTLISTSNKKDTETKWRVSFKIKYNDIPVADMYIFYRCQDGFMRRYDPVDKIYFWPNSTFPAYFIDNLVNTTLRDVEFPAPCEPELFVEHYYGPLWKIPIRALSQNGKNHPDYDFYGNYKYSSLSFFVKFLKENKNLELKPHFDKENFKYIFPYDQIKWIRENEMFNN